MVTGHRKYSTVTGLIHFLKSELNVKWIKYHVLLKIIQQMLEDLFAQCLKTCFHHTYGHVYRMFEDMFTLCLQGQSPEICTAQKK